jgi:hypothetical protein
VTHYNGGQHMGGHIVVSVFVHDYEHTKLGTRIRLSPVVGAPFVAL